MKQKLAALFVTVALALCALPMAAFAEGGTTRVKDEAELTTAVQDANCTTIELTADITLTQPVSFGRNVTLKSADGGPYTLAADGSFSENENLVTFTAGGTVNSLNLDAGGKAKYAIHAYNCAVTVEDSGVSGGRYRGLLVNGENASANISNCTFENNTWAAIEVASSSAGVPKAECVTLGQGITSDKALVQVDINGSQDHYAGAYVQFKDGASYSFPIVGEKSLQEALNAVADGGTVTLGADISLAAPVQVPAGKTVIVNGGGYGITLTAAGAAFNESASVEGLKAGTSLTVNNVSFTGHTVGQADHAVVVGSEGGVNVALNGCSFTNMYDAVYCNQVTDPNAAASSITISGCSFNNVAHSYGVDDGATTNGRVDKHNFTLTNNTNAPDPETFAVASVDGVGYTSLDAALTAVATASNKTVTLRKDVALDKMLTIDADGLVLDLNGKTITASDAFQSSYPNDSHLINIGSETATVTGVTVKNGTVRTTAANKHAVNVYKSAQVTLKDLTLDHTTASTGAPLVVNSSSVKVEGKLDLKLGAKSWYGINVDGKYNPAGLVFNPGSSVTMTGKEGLLVISTGKDASIAGAEAAGLQDNGNGTFGLKPAPTPAPTPKPEEPWTPGPTATPAPAQVLDSTPKTGAVSLAVLPLAGLAFAGVGAMLRKRED